MSAQRPAPVRSEKSNRAIYSFVPRSVRFILPVVATVLVLSASVSHGFQNLDFEAAQLPPIDPEQVGTVQVPIASALPSWSAYVGNNMLSAIPLIYSPFASMAILVAPVDAAYWNNYRIEGNYSVQLQATYTEGGQGGPPANVAIGQTSLLPAGALSLRFTASEFGTSVTHTQWLVVSFNGTLLPVSLTGGDGRVSQFETDLTGLGGRVGELRFTVLAADDLTSRYFELDSIEIVTVPEPSLLALTIVGSALVGVRARRKESLHSFRHDERP